MMGIALIFSLGFNIYSAAAYSQYFQTDADMFETFHSGEEFASKKIAIINISGVMLQSDGYAYIPLGN